MGNLNKKKVLTGQSNKHIERLEGVGEGKKLAMFANGPSILEAPIEKLLGVEGVDTMTLKRPDERCFPTTSWIMADVRDIKRMSKWIKDYQGNFITSNFKVGRLPGSKHPVKMAKHTRLAIKPGQGFRKNIVGPVFSGYSSAYIGLQVALFMGYESIYIFGMDMAEVDGKMYNYPKDENILYPGLEQRNKMFELEASAFLWALGSALEEEDRGKIILCTENNPHEFASLLVTCTPEQGVNLMLNVQPEEEMEEDESDGTEEDEDTDS